MSDTLLSMIVTYSDIQSLLSRTNESEVTIRHPMARQMYEATHRLFKWHKRRGFASKALSSSSFTTGVSAAAAASRRGNNIAGGVFLDDEGDGLATDAGGEESDLEGGLDPDTETEMMAGGDNDLEDAQDDEESDGEGDEVLPIQGGGRGGGAAVVLGFGY